MQPDWREPGNRREIFQRSYTFSLRHRNFPGMVYSMLPAVADLFDLDDDGKAWLAWLNGNTQNVVTSMLLLEAAPSWTDWTKAVDFWNEHFKALEWDTDRRHQKNRFGEATEQWATRLVDELTGPAEAWLEHSTDGRDAFRYAMSQPHMGRISAWSYMEFARILLPFIPDVDGWYLGESSSRSHRNALCMLAGYDEAWGWDKEQSDIPFMLDLLPELEERAEGLLLAAEARNAVTVYGANGPEHQVQNPLVSRLTLESALCTFKSWHKPNRRYPNVYADMMYQRIRKAETRFGRTLTDLWEIRKDTLPPALRLEDNPGDPGLSSVKQNWFRETGEVHYLHMEFPDMEPSGFERAVAAGEFGERRDPKW